MTDKRTPAELAKLYDDDLMPEMQRRRGQRRYSEVVPVRMSPGMLEDVLDAALDEGVSASAWVRTAIADRLRR